MRLTINDGYNKVLPYLGGKAKLNDGTIGTLFAYFKEECFYVGTEKEDFEVEEIEVARRPRKIRMTSSDILGAIQELCPRLELSEIYYDGDEEAYYLYSD